MGRQVLPMSVHCIFKAFCPMSDRRSRCRWQGCPRNKKFLPLFFFPTKDGPEAVGGRNQLTDGG